MYTILSRLNRKLHALCESKESWKDPYSPDYDRQWAEDALFHVLGPLTDDPTWVNSQWYAKLSGNPPVPGFDPGKPAPQWTTEEIVFAMAGDPNLLFRASGNPKSPGYGSKGGGAPLFRLAKRVARTYGRENDKPFIADMYQNGMVPLMKMMQPGFDESRKPFISYVMRTIQSAMEHGTGGGREESRAGGESSEYFVDPTGKMRDRLPSGLEKNSRGKIKMPKGWERIQVTGIQNILKLKDPKQIRAAADIVKDEFRTKRAHDKHPSNPFGPFSPAYYRIVNNYADAIESKNKERIEAAQSQLHQLMDEINDSATNIVGASTGIGQAISTLDRAKDPRKVIPQKLDALDIGRKTVIYDTEIQRTGEDEFSYQYRDAKGDEKFQTLSRDEVIDSLATRQGLGIQSMDVPGDDGQGSAAGNIQGAESDAEEKVINKDAIQYVLTMAMEHDLGQILKNSKKYLKMAQDMKCKKNKDGKPNIGGPMTPQEFRFIIRYMGWIGQNYPGIGVVRENVDIPRDGKKKSRNWLQPGEDPEIEPLPEKGNNPDGLWHSQWARNDYPQLGPVEIAEEMTTETKEFIKLGIPSARADRVAAGKPALSKEAAGNTAKAARIKITIMSDIHGLRTNALDESIEKSPIIESIRLMDAIDKELIVTTCEAMIRKLDQAIDILDPKSIRLKKQIQIRPINERMHALDTIESY